jgi:hypothetical protein
MVSCDEMTRLWGKMTPLDERTLASIPIPQSARDLLAACGFPSFSDEYDFTFETASIPRLIDVLPGVDPERKGDLGRYWRLATQDTSHLCIDSSDGTIWMLNFGDQDEEGFTLYVNAGVREFMESLYYHRRLPQQETSWKSTEEAQAGIQAFEDELREIDSGALARNSHYWSLTLDHLRDQMFPAYVPHLGRESQSARWLTHNEDGEIPRWLLDLEDVLFPKDGK